MTWYDIYLNKDEVQKLDDLFADSPFSVAKKEGCHTASILTSTASAGALAKPFMAYNSNGDVIFYDHTLASFTPQERNTIYQCLQQLPPLEVIAAREVDK